MSNSILFCFVFLSQVLLISGLYPRRVIGRVRYVMKNFPPSTHPKGYPLPVEHYERWLRNIARVNLAIVVAGLLIIALILGGLFGDWGVGIFGSSHKNDWDRLIVVPFFIVQLIAVTGYVNLSGCKFLLAMAKAPPPRVRTTELRRRQLIDFVSPTMLVVTALTNVAFIAFALYYYSQTADFPWFKASVTIASALLMLLVFSIVVAIALRAPRTDPYQADQDRFALIKLVVQQALTMCIGYPVLFTALLFAKLFDPTMLYAVIASVFCQGIAVALLWPSFRYRAETIDFDVYRQDMKNSLP